MKYYCVLLGIYAAVTAFYLKWLFSGTAIGVVILWGYPFALIFLLVFSIGFFKMAGTLISKRLSEDDKLIKCWDIQGWTIIPVVFFSIVLINTLIVRIFFRN